MLKLEVTTKVHDMSMDTKGTLGAVGEELALRRRTSSMTMTKTFLTKLWECCDVPILNQSILSLLGQPQCALTRTVYHQQLKIANETKVKGGALTNHNHSFRQRPSEALE